MFLKFQNYIFFCKYESTRKGLIRKRCLFFFAFFCGFFRIRLLWLFQLSAFPYSSTSPSSFPSSSPSHDSRYPNTSPSHTAAGGGGGRYTAAFNDYGNGSSGFGGSGYIRSPSGGYNSAAGRFVDRRYEDSRGAYFEFFLPLIKKKTLFAFNFSVGQTLHI